MIETVASGERGDDPATTLSNAATTGQALSQIAADGFPPAFRRSAEPGAVPELDAALSELAPSPDVWRKLEVDGGPDAILARRPVTAHSQGYVYDLWLLEHIADRLGA